MWGSHDNVCTQHTDKECLGSSGSEAAGLLIDKHYTVQLVAGALQCGQLRRIKGIDNDEEGI